MEPARLKEFALAFFAGAAAGMLAETVGVYAQLSAVVLTISLALATVGLVFYLAYAVSVLTDIVDELGVELEHRRPQ